MQVTFSIQEELLKDAKSFTGISDDETLFKEALTALVQRTAVWRLVERGGTEPDLEPIPRRRSAA